MADSTESLRAGGLICSLKPSPADDIAPGVEADVRDSDQWPPMSEKLLAADEIAESVTSTTAVARIAVHLARTAAGRVSALPMTPRG